VDEKYSIVLSGAGSKIMLHVGFVQALHEAKIGYDKIAGSSAGSIIAGCLGIGMHPEELYVLTLKTNFTSLIFGHNRIYHYLLALRNGYASNGKKLRMFLESLYKGKRFCDLDVELFLTAYCIEDRSSVIFSRESHPDMFIVDAVLASSALPFALQPVGINGKHYIDGGIAKNFAVDLPQLGNSIIGHLISQDEIGKVPSGIVGTFKSIFDDLFFANPAASIADCIAMQKDLCVIRSHYDVGMFDFDISREAKLKMFYAGFFNTENKVKELKSGTV